MGVGSGVGRVFEASSGASSSSSAAAGTSAGGAEGRMPGDSCLHSCEFA